MRELLKYFSLSIFGIDKSQAILSELPLLILESDVLQHPYGFYVMRPGIAVGRYQLRIHVWLAGERNRQNPDWPPHTHNSVLHSLVVKGAVVSRTWDWIEQPDGRYVQYEVGYDGSNSILSRTSSVGALQNESSALVEAGMSYTVPPHLFHATDVSELIEAVTLVLVATEVSGNAVVAGDSNGLNQYIFERAAVNEERRKMAKDAALSAITGAFRV